MFRDWFLRLLGDLRVFLKQVRFGVRANGYGYQAGLFQWLWQAFVGPDPVVPTGYKASSAPPPAFVPSEALNKEHPSESADGLLDPTKLATWKSLKFRLGNLEQLENEVVKLYLDKVMDPKKTAMYEAHYHVGGQAGRWHHLIETEEEFNSLHKTDELIQHRLNTVSAANIMLTIHSAGHFYLVNIHKYTNQAGDVSGFDVTIQDSLNFACMQEYTSFVNNVEDDVKRGLAKLFGKDAPLDFKIKPVKVPQAFVQVNCKDCGVGASLLARALASIKFPPEKGKINHEMELNNALESLKPEILKEAFKHDLAKNVVHINNANGNLESQVSLVTLARCLIEKALKVELCSPPPVVNAVVDLTGKDKADAKPVKPVGRRPVTRSMTKAAAQNNTDIVQPNRRITRSMARAGMR